MKFLENLFRTRFNNARSTDGINPDELWKSISSAFPEEKVIPKTKKSRGNKYLYLLLLLLIPAGFILFGVPKINQSSEKTEEINIIHNKESHEDISSKITDKKELQPSVIASPEDNRKEKKGATKSNNSLEQTPSANQAVLITKGSSRLKPNKYKTKGSTSEKALNSSDETVKAHYSTEDQASIAVKGNSLDQSTQNPNHTSIQLPATLDGEIAPATFLPYRMKALNYSFNTKINTPSLPAPINRIKKKKPLHLGLFSGINTLANRYQQPTSEVTNNYEDVLQEANSSKPGHSTLLTIQWNFHKDLFLTTGIEYHRTENKFNLVQKWDTVMYRDNIPGNKLIDAEAVRTVKHHNRQTFLSVPVLVGIKKQFGRFDLGASAGVGLNIFLSQKGKTLSPKDQIVTYDSQGRGPLAYNALFLSYQVRPFVNYYFNTKFSIQLQPGFRYQVHSQSDLYQLKSSSLFFGLQTGINIRL